MPPKAKFSKDDMIAAALALVREDGFEALTARSLGARLGTSSCPIFTLFTNMEEVQQSVLTAARSLYKTYVEKGLTETPAFKGVGTQYILFAIREPKLFQLLFMTEQSSVPDLAGVLPQIEENYDRILASILKEYKVSLPAAENLYRHLWIYTHGIASLCATKMCHFTGEEIRSMMTEVFTALRAQQKGTANHD